MTVKELREKYGKLATRIQELAKAAEGRPFTADEKAEWERINPETDTLREQIDVQERAAAVTQHAALAVPLRSVQNDSGQPAHDPDKGVIAFRKFLRWGPSELDAEERALLRPQRADGDGRERRGRGTEIEVRLHPQADAPEFRAQTVGTGSEGGFTVPEGFMNRLEISMKAFGGMREAAFILPTASGNDLPWPTSDDTGNTGELLAESASVGSHVGVTVGQIILKAYKYSSKLIQVSAELLEDSAFDVAAWLGGAIGERLGRITNTHFTTGDNAAKPQGAVTASSLGKAAASATAVTVDELIDLFHSVDPAYRNGPGVRFMFKDSSLAALRKLTKADWAGEAAVWQPGLAAGEPATILGKRYIINQDMPAMTTGLKSFLFGDFGKYVIRDVASFRLRRLEELYAANDQVGFIAFSRHDGRLLDAGTDPIKHLIQA